MLEIIGAGLGRTGTDSLRAALDRLGFGPCHHMRDLFARPHTIAGWVHAAGGEPVDWGQVLGGYRSAVDWPSVTFWRELVEAYPHARVVLTVREPATWYESVTNTIYRARFRGVDDMPPALWERFRAMPEMADQLALVERLVWEGTFGGRFTDRRHAIEVYEAHIAAVRAYVPAGRLLEFEVAQGWRPLCGFLGVPVPPEGFPRLNTTAAFRARERASGGDLTVARAERR